MAFCSTVQNFHCLFCAACLAVNRFKNRFCIAYQEKEKYIYIYIYIFAAHEEMRPAAVDSRELKI